VGVHLLRQKPASLRTGEFHFIAVFEHSVRRDGGMNRCIRDASDVFEGLGNMLSLK